MKKLPLLSVSLVLGFAVVGMLVRGGSNFRRKSRAALAGKRSSARHLMQTATLGWIMPRRRKSLLYVSDEGDQRIDIFSVPKYQSYWTDSPKALTHPKESQPSRRWLALRIQPRHRDTVTVYKHGQSTPSLTLTEPGWAGRRCRREERGTLLVGGHVRRGRVFHARRYIPKGQTLNPAISFVGGVGVDASNNVYAAGVPGVVIKFAKMKVPGTNLGLTGPHKSQPACLSISMAILSCPTTDGTSSISIRRADIALVNDFGGQPERMLSTTAKPDLCPAGKRCSRQRFRVPQRTPHQPGSRSANLQREWRL